MICYKDKTFCAFDTCREFGQCHRALNIRVANAADKWWGAPDAPIARFTEHPDCFKDKHGRQD